MESNLLQPSHRAADHGALFFYVSVGILIFATAYSRISFHGDTFFYIASGDWIFDNKRLPDKDPFSANAIPTRWILHFPLLQIGFSFLNRSFGFGAIHLTSAAVGTAALLLFWLPHAKSFIARIIALIPIGLLLLVDKEHFIARGQLFGNLYFAFLLIVLIRLREGRTIHWLVPIALTSIWINSHPSFIIGLVLPIAFLCVSILEPAESRSPTAPYWKFFFLSLAATGITPYHFQLLIDDLKLFTHPGMKLITLFRSPDFHQPEWIAMITAAMGILAARMYHGPARTKKSDILLHLFFLYATCYSRRYAVYLCVWEIVLLNSMVQDRIAGFQETMIQKFNTLLRNGIRGVSGCLIAGSAYLLSQPFDYLQNSPHQAVQQIEQLNLPDNILNLYPWGGYLMYRWEGRRKVFIDGRNNRYSPSLVYDYLCITYLCEGWENLLDIYYIRTILWLADTPLDHALKSHPGWKEVFRDASSVVYVKQST